MNNCPLCKREVRTTQWFYTVLCDTCNRPLIISTDHKKEFTKQEKEDIRKLFGNQYNIRWNMRDLPQKGIYHAHSHLIPFQH